MEQYIQVVEEEFDEPVELPAEADGTLLIATLSAQFPGATGLKYRNESSGNWRGVRVIEDKLQAPDGAWSETMVFCVVYPKGHTSNSEGKRKGEQVFDSAGTTAKMKKPASEADSKTSDLVILGLAYTATESDIKEYFDAFGQVLMTQIKRDHATQKSKGFGFVRMGDYESQIKILSQRHMICGRWCEVKLPNSNANRVGGSSADSDILNRKIFVGRCTEEVTQEDLRDYFTKFGEVVDVYIPKPFRAFAFVTFSNPLAAAGLCGQDHIINNASVHISSADPKDSFRNRGDNYGGGGRYQRGRSSSPNRGSNQMANGGMGMQGPPGGNMGGGMGNGMGSGGGGGGGFNMGNFPMNPAMFAALASQGMFGMPNMMGGFPNQGNNQGYNSQAPGNFNYGGYGQSQGYGNGYSQGQQQQPQPGPPQNQVQGQTGDQPSRASTTSWNQSGSGDASKDSKGAAGWGQTQAQSYPSKPEPMNSSWS